MSTLLELIETLAAKRTGLGWMAKCPAHNDRNPSLSIRESEDKILVHCHAGCEQRDVIDALKARGLWKSSHSVEESRVVSTYDYTDQNGELLYQVVRFEPKNFRQRRPNGRGGWIWKKNPRQALYRLLDVLESPIIFLVEGEKDVETLRTHGFVATTNAGGATAIWLPAFTDILRGRRVILIPDNDGPGWQRVKTIARALLNSAAHIIILDLPGAKDVTEWFAAGHSECELIAMLEGVSAV